MTVCGNATVQNVGSVDLALCFPGLMGRLLSAVHLTSVYLSEEIQFVPT